MTDKKKIKLTINKILKKFNKKVSFKFLITSKKAYKKKKYKEYAKLLDIEYNI